MFTERAARIRSIFLDALELAPAQREAFLAQACGGDEALRAEIEALLRSAVSVDDAATQLHPADSSWSTNLRPGDVLSERFKILRHIASGGMGAVYEAEDLTLRERVALKTILSGTAANEAAIERFKREIYLARKVTHVNVCRIFDFAEHKDRQLGQIAFLTMELLPGETLFRRIRSSGPLSTKEALPIVTQMTAGLAAAHEAGVIHRDFKSPNVILVPSGEGTRAVITDFGLARGKHRDTQSLDFHSRTGAISGTPTYMAPEQVKGGEITPATDIYALGVVMYEMVTGTWPFTGENSWEVANKRLLEGAPSPRAHAASLDPRWERAILRCLEREPEKRFASALDVAKFLEGEAVTPSRRQKRRRLVIASSLVGLAMGAEAVHLILPKQAESRRAVAVMGFQNISSMPEVAWVSTALSEGLRSELAAAGKLRTVSGEEIADFKRDAGVSDFSSLSKQKLSRLHQLGADLVVVGSYTDFGKDAGGKIVLNLAIQDASRGETIEGLRTEGSEKDISGLVSDAGARLRAKLHLGELSTEKEAQLAVAQPNPEVAPLYSEGLNRLRAYDLSGARELFQKAILASPSYPFAHAALAETWSMLGYDARAKEEAKKAFDLSAKLPLEDRLSIEGRSREMASDWKGAIDSYGELYQHFPDNLEYGLRLAHAQMSSGNASAALETLAKLRQLPAPQGNDPRIELEHAETAASVGDYKSAKTAAASAISTAKAQGAKVLELRALNWGCPVYRHLGELDKARSLCKQAIQIGSAVGDKLGMARAVNGLANVDNDQGNLKEALAGFEEAFRITSDIGARRDMSGALNNVAMVLASSGNFEEARKKYEQALGIQREISFTSDIPRTLSNLGDVLHQEGKLSQARSIYDEAIAIARKNGSNNALMLGLSSLGDLSFDQGNLSEAEQEYAEALSLQRSSGAKEDIAETLQSKGRLQLAKGNLPGAEQDYREALALQKEIGNPDGAARSHVGLARIQIEQKNFFAARTQLNGTLAQFEKDKDGDSEARVHAALARCYLEESNLGDAQQEIRTAVELAGHVDAKSLYYEVNIIAARVHAKQDASSQANAIQKLREIGRDARQAGMTGYELEARLALAQIQMAGGNHADLEALNREASAKGFRLIAQRASETGSAIL